MEFLGQSFEKLEHKQNTETECVGFNVPLDTE